MIFERGHFKAKEYKNLNESLRETLMFSSTKFQAKPTIFISHKHSDLRDQEELQGVIELLEEMGAKIYIDSMDNSMPEHACGDTALRIKDVIKHCDKFILIATEKAIESYWCNWELGIGDTHKYIDHIAILPIKEEGEHDRNYLGNEYLQIYPRLDFRNGDSYCINSKVLIKKGYYVCKPRNKEGIMYITPLKKWLNK